MRTNGFLWTWIRVPLGVTEMKTAYFRVVRLVSAILLLFWSASPASSPGQVNGQRGQLLRDGNLADAVLTRDAERLTLTITAKSSKRHPPDWSGVKVSASCWPYEQRFGGFSFDMALVNTNTVKGKRASAVFAFKGEPSAIEQISDVTVTAGPDGSPICYISLPLSRGEVLARFRARASKEDIRRFQALRLSRDLESEERALELVLFKLTPSELMRIGVNQQARVPYPGPGPATCLWVFAGASSLDGTQEAVNAVLAHARIDAGAIGNLGIIHWYGPKEEFFRARRALLAAKDARVRACAVGPPQFSF